MTDPLELGARARAPAAVVVRLRPRARRSATAPGPARRSRSTASARGESDNQGWFSYDDGTRARAAASSATPATGSPAVAGGNEIHLFGVSAAAARRCRRCAASCRAARSLDPTWSPDGSMLAWQAADGVHVAGPVPDLRAAVPDCSVIRERRLAAGSDPYWGAADVPGASCGHAGARRAGGAAARRARSARCGSRGASAGARCALRLRITRGPARVEARLRHGGRRAGRVRAAPGARGDAAPAGAAQRGGAARARPPRAADAAPHRDGARARPLARHALTGAWRSAGVDAGQMGD